MEKIDNVLETNIENEEELRQALQEEMDQLTYLEALEEQSENEIEEENPYTYYGVSESDFHQEEICLK